MLMHNFLLLFPKMPYVRTMYAWLFLVVEEMYYVILLHGKFLSASMAIFSKLWRRPILHSVLAMKTRQAPMESSIKRIRKTYLG